MKQDFLIIAEALGYKKLERLRHAGNKVDSDVLLNMIKLSIVDPYAILFFPGKCYQITPFGVSFAHAISRNDRTYVLGAISDIERINLDRAKFEISPF
jgi:hypothetical protein